MVDGTRCSSGLDEVPSVNAKVLKLLPRAIQCRNCANTFLEETAELSTCLDPTIYAVWKITSYN